MEILLILIQARRNSYHKDSNWTLPFNSLISHYKRKLLGVRTLCCKYFTLECPKFNSSRHILGNTSMIKQALDEENSKNIYNFFTNAGLSKLL